MNRIIIIGRGGAGKDYLRKHFQNKGIIYHASYTTRLPRPGEQDGKDYHFLSEQKFNQMTEEDQWSEKQEFNSYQYGTTKDQFYCEKPNVLIMSPPGIACISPEDRQKSFVIYLNPPQSETNQEEINKRLQARGFTEETIEKRKKANDSAFSKYQMTLPGIEVNDLWFDAEKIVSQVLDLLLLESSESSESSDSEPKKENTTKSKKRKKIENIDANETSHVN